MCIPEASVLGEGLASEQINSQLRGPQWPVIHLTEKSHKISLGRPADGWWGKEQDDSRWSRGKLWCFTHFLSKIISEMDVQWVPVDAAPSTH